MDGETMKVRVKGAPTGPRLDETEDEFPSAKAPGDDPLGHLDNDDSAYTDRPEWCDLPKGWADPPGEPPPEVDGAEVAAMYANEEPPPDPDAPPPPEMEKIDISVGERHFREALDVSKATLTLY